jgi:hypothetical protein
MRLGDLALKEFTAAVLAMAVLSVLAAVGYLEVFVVRVTTGQGID